MTPTFNLQPGSYFGGKNAAGVVHTIINQIPAHEVFVSGFLGRCAIMRYKRAATVSIGVDMDTAVIAEWREASGKSDENLFLVNGDFLKIDLPSLGARSTFLYLDPPYPKETRTSDNTYNFELTNNQHRQLLEKAKALPCMVAISCYDCELYRYHLDGLPNWRKIQFKSQTRGGQRTETLYMNYPEPEPHELHDPRFLGTGFRPREKTKRRLDTIKRKIERLEAHEKARLSDWLRAQLATPEVARAAASAGIAESGEAGLAAVSQ